MEGFQCDQCLNFSQGEPAYEVSMNVIEFGRPSRYTFDTWGCVLLWAKEQRKERDG